MSNDAIISRLNTLKAQIEKGKTDKAKAEANLEIYTRQKEELIAQLAELGVTPETLDDEINRLEQEIESGLEQAEALLKVGDQLGQEIVAGLDRVGQKIVAEIDRVGQKIAEIDRANTLLKG